MRMQAYYILYTTWGRLHTHIHTHTGMHTGMHAYAHTHTHTHTHTHVKICTHADTLEVSRDKRSLNFIQPHVILAKMLSSMPPDALITSPK